MAIGVKDKPARIASEPGSGPVKGAGGGKGGGADEAPPAKKSKKKKIIVAVVALLVLGGAAKFTVLAPAKAAGVAKPVPGAVVPMEDMTLNLANGHFLRLKIALQTTKGTSDAIDTAAAQQIIIDEFSNRTVASLTGKANRDKIQAAALAKIQKEYPKEIMAIPYTGFVMQ